MTYFLLQADPLFTDAPVIQDWHDKIDRSQIKPGLSHDLPRRIVLNIYPNAYTTFIDVVDSPFLLLSKPCMDVVKVYEPQIISKQIILLDSEHRSKQTYYLPILPHLKCLSAESVYSPDHRELKEGVLDLSCIGDEGIFHLSNLSRFYTVVRLDILESMLKRGARGIKITPLKTVPGERGKA